MGGNELEPLQRMAKEAAKDSAEAKALGLAIAAILSQLPGVEKIDEAAVRRFIIEQTSRHPKGPALRASAETLVSQILQAPVAGKSVHLSGPLPYVDYLLSEFSHDSSRALKTSFGRHLHSGFWKNPKDYKATPENFGLAAEEMVSQIAASAGISNGMSMLDVGCGFGGTIAWLNANYSGCHLVGIDIHPQQLERARSNINFSPQNQVTLKQGNAAELPFADASFDRILSVESAYHFPNREAFMAQAFRVLKPGGLLVMSDFVPAKLLLSGKSLMSSNWFDSNEIFGSANFDYTLSRYRRAAARQGFRSVQTNDVTRNMMPTYQYLKSINLLQPAGGWIAKAQNTIFSSLYYAGSLGLLRYFIMTFAKPR